MNKALIVDDHRLFAEAVKPILERIGFDVTTAANAKEALSYVSSAGPSLVLVDIGLPGEDGLSVGRRILELTPDATVIAVTAMEDPDLVTDVLRAGFRGFVTKDTSVSRFETAVRSGLDGHAVIPKRLARRVGGGRSDDVTDLLVRQLTPREREVLSLLAAGASGKEIAEELSISSNTVRTHVQSILTKLQVHSRLEAAAFAVRKGLTQGSRSSAAVPSLRALEQQPTDGVERSA